MSNVLFLSLSLSIFRKVELCRHYSVNENDARAILSFSLFLSLTACESTKTFFFPQTITAVAMARPVQITRNVLMLCQQQHFFYISLPPFSPRRQGRSRNQSSILSFFFISRSCHSRATSPPVNAPRVRCVTDAIKTSVENI